MGGRGCPSPVGAAKIVFMTDLFSSPVLRVDQPRRAPAARSRYKVTDGNGTVVAIAEERDISLLRQTVRAALGGSDGRRVVHVESGQGVPLMVVDKLGGHGKGARVWTSDGAPIGSFHATTTPMTYSIHDGMERSVGQLSGNRLGRKFAVLDAYGAHVAQVDKKWKGLATEVLTTADRYSVEVYQPLYEPLRTLVPAAPLAIDLMLYETKDWTLG